MSKKKTDKISPRGSDAVAFLSEICTPAEIEAADMKARLVSALIAARDDKKLTQQKLADACGLPQPSLARIERGTSVPRIDTFCKIVASLGLEVVLRRKRPERTACA